MSSRKPTEDKAIAWWCELHGLIPQLSTHPTYYFLDRATGEVTEAHIQHLTIAFKKARDEAKGDKKARSKTR